ncbi:MAG: BLUF domain-containing protein [Actinomycetota bacterium]|jgi:hypothetical protein|nr:BLUF domain-containing protein [Rubrobacter sp.]MDQ3508525.1 BLUF domain-containing protein [Actinomycetota bacterium]
MSSLFSLTYVSSAVRPFSREELDELLAVSRENNARLGITGMLLYKDGNFMQVLEGDEGEVRALYGKISSDPRHGGEMTLHKSHSDGRSFPDWTMGFQNLDSPEARSSPGYSEFLNSPLTGQEFSNNPSRSQKLLLTFKRSM